MSTGKRLRALIIDGDVAQCLGLSELLHLDGMTTYTAFDAQRGLEMARSLKPDAVLIDINMAGMSGYQLCDELRSSPDTSGLAIVLHSASETPKDLHGADSFITYPLPLSILTDVLRACITRRQSSRQAA